MRSHWALLLLVLFCAYTWVDDVSASFHAPDAPLTFPVGDDDIYPIALRYRQQLLENLEAHHFLPVSLCQPELLPELGLAVDGWWAASTLPLSGVDRLYAFMSLQR